MSMLNNSKTNIYITEGTHSEVTGTGHSLTPYQVLQLFSNTMVPFCTNGCSISLSKVLVNLSHQKSFICNKYLIVMANIGEFGILKKIYPRKKTSEVEEKDHVK